MKTSKKICRSCHSHGIEMHRFKNRFICPCAFEWVELETSSDEHYEKTSNAPAATLKKTK